MSHHRQLDRIQFRRTESSFWFFLIFSDVGGIAKPSVGFWSQGMSPALILIIVYCQAPTKCTSDVRFLLWLYLTIDSTGYIKFSLCL